MNGGDSRPGATACTADLDLSQLDHHNDESTVAISMSNSFYWDMVISMLRF